MSKFDGHQDDDLDLDREVALKRIRFLMEFWGISCDDLSSHEDAPSVLAPTPRVEREAKYRHPESGDSWDGTGEQPEWLKRALLHEGLTVEQLRAPSRPSDQLLQATAELHSSLKPLRN